MSATEVITWWDSNNPADRRRMVELWLPAGELHGTLYECERAEPGDVWPPATKRGEGVSYGYAKALAVSRNLRQPAERRAS